jgi:hypothetical protein
MNFKRGDSLHDFICNVPVRIELLKQGDYAADLDAIDKLGAKLHKTNRADTKRKLRLEIVERRLALSQRVVSDEIAGLRAKANVIADDWFGDSVSDAEKRRKLEEEIKRLEKALAQLKKDEAEFRKLQRRPMDKDLHHKLRELEGSVPDGPYNFAWRIDFPHVLSTAPKTTLAGEMALVNEAQTQQEILSAPSTINSQPSTSSGFDILVGNPPFVTARNPIKRELYRERWPRVCHMKFLLVCPFFELSFGLLKPEGQLGFIVSNAFAKREFGKPLVEDFFPTVDLQKVVDCSGLMFPGHGTPTCIVFGTQRKPDEKSPVRVAAILPGGGDLRTPPEESSLWHTLAAQHDNPGFTDSRIAVSDRSRKQMSKHPWALDSSTGDTVKILEGAGAIPLIEFLADEIGVCTMTNADDIFLLSDGGSRRIEANPQHVLLYHQGEELRNWLADPPCRILLPYRENCQPMPEKDLSTGEREYLRPFKTLLENRHTFGNKTFKEAGRVWYEFERMNANKYSTPRFITFSHIATHNHFIFVPEKRVFGRHPQVIKLAANASDTEHHLLAGLLNSSLALFWLKQVCFSKRESEEGATDTYFEFSGGKVQLLPTSSFIADSLRGKPDALAEQLTALSRACWERGRELPSLALRKLFEKSGEAYHAWNAALPGHVAPHAKLGAPFTNTAELQERFARAMSLRDQFRAEMVAQQEEMDWLVYAAYGLLAADHPAAQIEVEPAPLDQAHRPFRLWESAGDGFAKAAALIPGDWPTERKKVWEARLSAIRDNEHVRRIEQPVYKRRWDEQWKVGNRWMAGPVAYAQEFVDAFRWWLAEKAEWHLENKAGGGPVELGAWTAALWKDKRTQAAWPVVAHAIHQVGQFKFDASENESKKLLALDASYESFAKFLKETVADESVPAGIPPAVSWDDLAAKKKWTSAQLKKAQAVRGKLNVPRERFQQTEDGEYVWAGKGA